MQSTILSDASGSEYSAIRSSLLPRATLALVEILKRISEHRRIKMAQWRLTQTVDMGEGNRRFRHALRLGGPAPRSEPRLTLARRQLDPRPDQRRRRLTSGGRCHFVEDLWPTLSSACLERACRGRGRPLSREWATRETWEAGGIDVLACGGLGSNDASGHHGNACQRCDSLRPADGDFGRVGPLGCRGHKLLRIDRPRVRQRRYGIRCGSAHNAKHLPACGVRGGWLPDRRIADEVALDAIRAFLSCGRARRRHYVRAYIRLCRKLVPEGFWRSDWGGSCWSGGRPRWSSVLGSLSHRDARMAARRCCRSVALHWQFFYPSLVECAKPLRPPSRPRWKNLKCNLVWLSRFSRQLFFSAAHAWRCHSCTSCR